MSTSSSLALSAGTLSGSAFLSAPTITLAIRFSVAVREFTGAGSTGLTRLPSGRLRVTGRKQPPLVGMDGSVRARTA